MPGWGEAQQVQLNVEVAIDFGPLLDSLDEIIRSIEKMKDRIATLQEAERARQEAKRG